MTTTLTDEQTTALCANPDCGRPFLVAEGWDGTCDPCAARECEHLAGDHAAVDPECRYCA